ncbi:VOC family protein [Fusibacter bizertensis]
MYRSMMQVYVEKSDKAVEFYQKVFDAKLVASHLNCDGTYMHAELDIYGQILAISEADQEKDRIEGNNMQFCLHFGEGNETIVTKIYDILKEDAKIDFPLCWCGYSPLMASLVDKFGVYWCIFV